MSKILHCDEMLAVVETKSATVHVHDGPDGIIIDVWRERYREPVFTCGLDHDDLDPGHLYPPEDEEES